MEINEHVDRLEASAHEHGYDYHVMLDIATESMWSATVKLTLAGQSGPLARSIMFDARGDQEPEGVLEDAVVDALEWLHSGAKL